MTKTRNELRRSHNVNCVLGVDTEMLVLYTVTFIIGYCTVTEHLRL